MNDVMDALDYVHDAMIAANSVSKVKKYRPSNATEGDSFVSRFCSECVLFAHCEIPLLTHVLGVEDDAYPEEWRYDASDRPVCTAFDSITPMPEPWQRVLDEISGCVERG
jgi:hypothetical protein